MNEGAKSSWEIGWESVKANRLPMVVLWILALVMVSAYYRVSGVSDVLRPLAIWQRDSGWQAAFANRFFFCGVLPGVFLLAIKKLRPKRPFAVVFAQTLWSGWWGVTCDWFFRLQDLMFGHELKFSVLLCKVLLGQFVWTVFVIAPANAVFFFWVGRDFSFRRVRDEWPRHFFGDLVMPNLVSNWMIWIPVAFAIYAFPVDLQVQISGFVCSFWILMCLQIGLRTQPPRRAN